MLLFIYLFKHDVRHKEQTIHDVIIIIIIIIIILFLYLNMTYWSQGARVFSSAIVIPSLDNKEIPSITLFL